MGTMAAMFLGFCIGAAAVVAFAIAKARTPSPAEPNGAASAHQRLEAALHALETIARQGEGPLAAIARRALQRDAIARATPPQP